jgi:hypothetical protein
MRIDEIIETHLDEIDRRGFLRGLGAAGAAAALPGLAKAQSQTVPPVYLKAVNDIKAYLKPRFDKLPSPMIQYKKGIIVIKMTGTKVVGAEMKESTGVPKLDDYIIRVITAAGSFPQVQPLGRTGDHVMEFTTNNLLPAPGEGTVSQNQQPAQQTQSPVTVLQQFANNILKQRPNSIISKFEYQIYTDGVSLITAKGNFGNEEIFAFTSPTGKFNPKGLAPKMSKLTELEKPNHLIFGGSGYTQIARIHADSEIKAEKDFYFDNDKKIVTDAPSIKKSQEGKGIQRFDNYVIFSGYSIDEIKDQLIEKVMSKDKDTQVDDNGRILTLKMHNPEGKHFGMALYKSLMGPRYSNMDVIIKFIFSSKGELVKVIPQATINITNAFGRTETTPMNASEALDSLERLF